MADKFENEMIFGEKLEGIEYKERAGAYGVAFNEEGKVAVIKTHRGYFLPGGGIEEGENHEECIIREFKEETGFEVEVKQFIGKASNYRFAVGLNGYYHLIGFNYLVQLKERTAEPIEEDHELLWMEPKECADSMYLEHQAWAVKEALRKTFDKN